MILANVEPGETGYDVRTFKCSRCRRFRQYVIESNVTETRLTPPDELNLWRRPAPRRPRRLNANLTETAAPRDGK